MKLGTEDKKKLGILAVVGVLGLGSAFYLYSELSTPDVPAPAAAAVATTAAPVKTNVPKKVAVAPGNAAGVSSKAAGAASGAVLDPTLHMEAMLVTESLVYSGSGRNIFSGSSTPSSVAIPRLVAKVRTPDLAAPVRLGPTGPLPPPPIDLKFFGTETGAGGGRRAFLLHGEDVFLVASGEIVQRRYRVISIDAHSLVIEDIANSNRQTLPLLVN